MNWDKENFETFKFLFFKNLTKDLIDQVAEVATDDSLICPDPEQIEKGTYADLYPEAKVNECSFLSCYMFVGKNIEHFSLKVQGEAYWQQSHRSPLDLFIQAAKYGGRIEIPLSIIISEAERLLKVYDSDRRIGHEFVKKVNSFIVPALCSFFKEHRQIIIEAINTAFYEEYRKLYTPVTHDEECLFFH